MAGLRKDHVFLDVATAATIFVDGHVPLLHLKGAHYTLRIHLGRSWFIAAWSPRRAAMHIHPHKGCDDRNRLGPLPS